jgi:hypothetical protein
MQKVSVSTSPSKRKCRDVNNTLNHSSVITVLFTPLVFTSAGTSVTTVEPGYNNIGLYDTSSIASTILRYQVIPHC